MRSFYNQVLNFFWTAISFLPVLWYWSAFRVNAGLFFILALSMIPAFFPEKWLQKMQISKSRKFYERAGVNFIKKFVQDGDIVHGRANKKARNLVVHNRDKASRYLKTISMYERYHLVAFDFFFLTSVHALFHGRYLLSFLIFLANIIYNIFPLLLQQYNKMRIHRLIRVSTRDYNSSRPMREERISQ